MKNLLETKSLSLQELLGNGKIYKIPTFQRDYSWKEENWEDLWNDIILTETDENLTHYMGTLVLQISNSNEGFIVVDGQQRLTTLTILIMGIIKVLSDFIEKGIEIEKNKERIENIQRDYIGKKTLTQLHYKSKLTLNKNNNLFFQDRILTLQNPVNYSKLRDSEKLLYDSFQYFYEKLKQKFNNDKGEKISYFLEYLIAKRILFIQILVDDDLSAYTVFETLNARGTELTTTDLLKNYLFAISSKQESQSDILEERWAKIVDMIGLKTFPNFLRYYLNSQIKLVRKEQLFKTIKSRVKTSPEVFNLLDKLEEKANLFNALKNPYDEFWDESPKKVEIKKSLEELQLYGVSQPIPLLFSAFEILPNLFHKVLNYVSVISFRYNIIGSKNPNELERVYNSVAVRIFNKELIELNIIKDELSKVYLSDEDFVNIFSTKEFHSSGSNKKIIKYILTKIENHLSGSDNDYNDSNFTIEHILPENFSEEWNKNFNNEAHKYIYRIGNYTLLEGKLNRLCSDKYFAEKKKIYISSNHYLTKTCLQKDEWIPKSLHDHQKFLAKQAAAIWKII